ncbi:uncharacterized protein F5Z01DRAFT_749424 [Emericellopsis atlantica]|uniref:Uncharacterized protein n=1 Tax=Emericellopsis atlantica TaxID=2614577 RepID=A0A9P7ZNE1_9HYPO|nr:uncharacterized protein F5Z01DRAFT_749424 [Emericellopsis atlantica]KAG9255220.1 hypothetical protein F5Z01DRAFT_749424 [Emericellopsis atlantica]
MLAAPASRDCGTRRDAASQGPTSTTPTLLTTRYTLADDIRDGIWTAERCVALLAQLESQLAALRRLAGETQHCTSNAGSHAPTNPNANKTGSILPNAKRKRVYQTYSSDHIRKRKQSTHRTAATPPRKSRVYGELRRSQQSPSANQLAVITPICAKNRRIIAHPSETYTTQNQRPEPLDDDEPSCPLDESLQSFRARIGEVRYRIYSTIFDWLRDLFLATAAAWNDPHSKSLLSMCLRRVPEYAEHIEEYERQGFAAEPMERPSSCPSASLALYSQLETLGYGPWSRALMLRAIRAHGVLILAKSVGKGLFDPSFISLLVDLCLSMGCDREAVRITSAVAWPLPRPRKATSYLAESSRSLPTHALLSVLNERSGRRCGLVFDHVSNLLKEKRLPPSWIHTGPFTEVFTYAVKAVRDGPCAAAAAELLALSANLAMHGNSSRLHAERGGCRYQTLVRIAAGLGTAAIMANRRRSESSAAQSGPFKRLCYALRWCAGRSCEQSLRQRGPGAFLFAFTELIACIDSEHCAFDAQKIVSHILTTTSETQDEYLYLALRLMRAMGRVLARGKDASYAHVDLVQFSRGLNRQQLPVWFLQGLDEAERDFGFVLHASNNAPGAAGAPAAGTWTPPPGWVWEDGIGEWTRSAS